MGEVMLSSAIGIVALMVTTWIVSLIKKNASIVDIVWGLGFVLVAWISRAVADGDDARQWILTVMTTAWGLRLGLYLLWRNSGHGEDFRYRAMRRNWGPRFPIISLVTVFGLQGTLMWIVSLPVQIGQYDSTPKVGVIAFIGIAVYLIGLFFEVVGDAQLARFKSDASNAGKVMDQGLWKFTRHPNYFGDSCVWWGIAIVAAETGSGFWGFIGAAVMTFFLRRVSGVTLLEKSLKKRREGYDAYIARTSPFFPRPPKKI